MIDDLLSLLGASPEAPSPTARVTQWLEVMPQSLALTTILVRERRDGMLVQQNRTRTNELFCAPWSPEIEAEVRALLGAIRLVREQAQVEEGRLRREIFRRLRAAREANNGQSPSPVNGTHRNA